MLRIILLLIVGTGIGFLTRRHSLAHKTEQASQIIVCMLLFVFGLSLGNNRELLSQFGHYGYHALSIAALAMLGSLVAAALAQRLFFGKGGRS